MRRDLVYHPNAENLRLLADYLREQRAEAQNILGQGYENNLEWWRNHEEWTQWWKDRLAWIEESADKLQLSLDLTNTSWTEDAVAYHQSLIDEKQEIRKRLLGNPTPLISPENIPRNEKFFDEYMMGTRRYLRNCSVKLLISFSQQLNLLEASRFCCIMILILFLFSIGGQI